MELKNGFGSAVYNATTHAMVYPSLVPKDRLPIPKADLKTVKKRKGLVSHFRGSGVLSGNSIPIGSLEILDNIDNIQISELIGENGWVDSQGEIHQSSAEELDTWDGTISQQEKLDTWLQIHDERKTNALDSTCVPVSHSSFISLPEIVAEECGPLREQESLRATPSNGDRFSQREGELGLGRHLTGPGVAGQSTSTLVTVPGGEIEGDETRMQGARNSLPTAVKGMRVSSTKSASAKSIFYIDSGAGQCLSSCSTAFQTLEPCTLEVVGVAGSLPIFGRGTAIFVLSLRRGEEILVRIHNCLYSFGEFNLISVSQMLTLPQNSLCRS
jgi:hypothetical protein